MIPKKIEYYHQPPINTIPYKRVNPHSKFRRALTRIDGIYKSKRDLIRWPAHRHSSITNELVKHSQEGIWQGTATEEFDEALPARAGGTAGVLGMLCCWVVGNAFGDPSFAGGVRWTCSPPISWPVDLRLVNIKE